MPHHALDVIWERVQDPVRELMRDRDLNPDLIPMIRNHYLPALNQLAGLQGAVPPIIGISGAPGTGKTTFAKLAGVILEQGYDLSVAAFSIDDCYLSRSSRRGLAQTTHPLLATRGVPGTHDLGLCLSTIAALQKAQTAQETPIPAFDKALDEPLSTTAWHKFKGRPDLILFDGWCVGARPQEPWELTEPINRLEQQQDPGTVWRTFVNHSLKDYQALFEPLDRLLFFQAPDFESVQAWRLQQEHQRIKRNPSKGGMSDEEVKHFLAHFERLIRHMSRHTPSHADTVFNLNRSHRIDQ